MNTFTEFKTKALFETVMNAGGLDGWSNYAGHDYSGWLCGPSESRDADILTQSNFNVALEMLGGESDGKVEVRHVSHWACGWLNQIMVKATSKQAKILFEIHKKLAHYPVLDDSDYHEREYEYQSEYAAQTQDELAEALSKHFQVKNTPALVDLAYRLNMEEQASNGNDSCINIYTCRAPGSSDLEQLARVLESIQWDYKRSRTFKALQTAVTKSLQLVQGGAA